MDYNKLVTMHTIDLIDTVHSLGHNITCDSFKHQKNLQYQTTFLHGLMKPGKQVVGNCKYSE